MPHVPPTQRYPNRRWVAAAAFGWVICATVDPAIGNEPYAERESGFFHRASNDVGNFFKRLFNTDEERNAPRSAPAPAPSKRRSKGLRYNLDQPPPELRNVPAAEPDREIQPQSEPIPPPREPLSSKTKGKTSAGSSSRGSSVAEEPPKSKPKSPKSSEAAADSPVASTENTVRSKPKKPAESNAPTDPGTVLYSNSSPPKPKEPEPPANVESEVTPTPPKAPSDSSNVMMGTKTGKSGRVKSPYAPYSELDVTGLPSGSLALDPTTQKVFRIP